MKHGKYDQIVRIEKETLSDGSEVQNVTLGNVTWYALDEKDAGRIFHFLTTGTPYTVHND